MKAKTNMMWLAVALASSLVMAVPSTSLAADIPTYDSNISRTRFAVDNSFNPATLYLSAPVLLHLPGDSVSTPTITGDVLYQYAYSGSTGTLYAVKLPTINTGTLLRRYGFQMPRYLSVPTQYAEPPLAFHASEGGYGVSAQDSLSTGQGWQAIAVGRHLYTWAQGRWPTSQSAIKAPVKIEGANAWYQVDMSPLITPSVATPVFSTVDLRVETLQLPQAVACSWDGGCAVEPLGLPKGDVPLRQIRYMATQTYSTDKNAAITSDPIYVPSEPLFGGQPAVAFGVASQAHPRVELLDLVTGQARSIGVGQVATPIADAGMLAQQGGQSLLVYHDSVDNIYAWNLDGKIVGVHPSGSTTISMGVDGSLTYPAFTGSMASVLQPTKDATEVAVVPIPSAKSNASGGYVDLVGASSPTTVQGSASGTSAPWCRSSGSPVDWCRYVTALTYQGTSRGGGPGIMLLSGATGGSAYIHNSAVADAGQLISAKVSPFVGALLDAGPGHYIVSWSNSTAVGPALEIWVPVSYTVIAQATPSTVPSGSSVTISARPIPSGVTSARLPWHPCNTGASPVTVRLSSTIGNSGYLDLSRTVAPSVVDPWSTWSVQYRLPSNTTGKPVTWNGTVTSVDKFCSTASSQVQFTEEPGSVPAPVSGGPLVLNPNPAMWSQNVVATLTPSAPSLPAGDRLVSWQITSAKLRYPLKNPNWAVTLPYFPTPLGASKAMTLDGHEAVTSTVENWWDGGCQDPAGIPVCIVNKAIGTIGFGSYPATQTIPALKSTVTATYTISGLESHTVISWKDVTDPKTGKTTRVKVTKTVTSLFTTGPQTASAQIVTNGDAKDVVGGG